MTLAVFASLQLRLNVSIGRARIPSEAARAVTLVVGKELEPTCDPGRFNLLVKRTVVVAGAGDGVIRGTTG